MWYCSCANLPEIHLLSNGQTNPTLGRWGRAKSRFKSTAIVLSSGHTKEYGGCRRRGRREEKMGKTSYFFHVNARLLVFLSTRSPYTLGKNEISLKVLDWKAWNLAELYTTWRRITLVLGPMDSLMEMIFWGNDCIEFEADRFWQKNSFWRWAQDYINVFCGDNNDFSEFLSYIQMVKGKNGKFLKLILLIINQSSAAGCLERKNFDIFRWLDL